CGNCGHNISSNIGFRLYYTENSGNNRGYIYICHQCNKPTYFDNLFVEQVPGPQYGEKVQHISDEAVSKLYDEARNSFGSRAYTASVLCCRKLLMHIAVSKGAAENLNFIE